VWIPLFAMSLEQRNVRVEDLFFFPERRRARESEREGERVYVREKRTESVREQDLRKSPM